MQVPQQSIEFHAALVQLALGPLDELGLDAIDFSHFKGERRTGLTHFQSVERCERLTVKQHAPVEGIRQFGCTGFDVGVVRRHHPKAPFVVELLEKHFRQRPAELRVRPRAKLVQQQQGVGAGHLEEMPHSSQAVTVC